MSRQARVLAVVRGLGLPFGVYALLALALIAPAISMPGASVPGSEGTDTFNGLWSFWFFGESVSDGRLPWDVSMLNYPVGGSLLVVDPLGALFCWVGSVFLGLSGAYHLLIVFRVALSGLLAHGFARSWLMEECGASPQAAHRAGWVAGVVYGGAPVLLVGIYNGNTESFNGAWLVAAVWAGWLAARNGGAKWILLAAVTLLGACLANWYSGICAFLFSASLFLWGSADLPSRKQIGARFMALALGLLFVLPVAMGVRAAHQQPSEISRIQTAEYFSDWRRSEGAATLSGWVFDRKAPVVDGRPGRSAYRASHGFGFLTILAATGGLVWVRRKSAFLLVGGAAGGVLAMGPGGSSALPYAWIEGWPGFESLSLLWRLGQAPALTLAVLAAAGCWRLTPRLGAVLGGGILLELVLFSPLSSGIPGVSIQVPESVRALGTAAPGVVVSYPTESRTRDLLYQVSHGQTLNRSLFTLSNEKEEDFWRAVESEPVDLEALKSAGYRYLLVQDHVGERTDPHRRVALSLEERLTARWGEGTEARVYAFW